MIRWRGGREAEGGGLLNRYTGYTGIVGSNPIPSATLSRFALRVAGHLRESGASALAARSSKSVGWKEG
jgi:hypothetical protein